MMKDTVVNALNKLFEKKDELLLAYEEISSVAFDISVLESELEEHNTKMLGYATQMNQATARNASKALDQDVFIREYDKISKKYKSEKTKVQELESAIKDKQIRKAKADAFIEHLADLDGPVETFSPFLWTSLCDWLIVYSPSDIRVVLKNGEEIKNTPIV